MTLRRSIFLITLIWLVLTAGLLVLAHAEDSDFWSLAVPTYITGTGTLALAACNVVLLQREAADRRRIDEREASEALVRSRRDAEAVIIYPVNGDWDDMQATDQVSITNAGQLSILRPAFVVGQITKDRAGAEWLWVPNNERVAAAIVPGQTVVCTGHWKKLVNGQVQVNKKPGHVDILTAVPLQARIPLTWQDSYGRTWGRSGPDFDPEEGLGKVELGTPGPINPWEDHSH